MITRDANIIPFDTLSLRFLDIMLYIEMNLNLFCVPLLKIIKQHNLKLG